MKFNIDSKMLVRVKNCVNYLKSIGEANSITWQSVAARPATAREFCEKVETEAARRKDILIESLKRQDNE